MSESLVINPKIQKWIAPLRDDELSLLEASLIQEGCREALIAWDGTLIDGHHRYEICQRRSIPFRVRSMDFVDVDHAEVWVRKNQAGRRNLTDDQRAVNADLQAEAESRIAKHERGKEGGKRGGRGRRDSLSTPVTDKLSAKPKKDSRKKAAKMHRVSEDRIRRAKKIRRAAPKLVRQVLMGDLTIKEAEKILRETDRTTKRTTAAEAAKTSIVDPDASIQHISLTDIVVDDDSVALVFTDPPYHDKTLPIYADLGRVAFRSLKPGGSLITYTSHHRMPEVIAMLQAAGLTFFWPLAMIHTGPKARMTEYGIVVHWKPLLWFVKGKFRSRDDMRFVNDLIESKPEKDAHPWQQGTTEARYYIEQLTQPGDLIFDPFCGGGTTAVAAKQTHRRWITCDVDEQTVWIARQRLVEAVA